MGNVIDNIVADPTPIMALAATNQSKLKDMLNITLSDRVGDVEIWKSSMLEYHYVRENDKWLRIAGGFKVCDEKMSLILRSNRMKIVKNKCSRYLLFFKEIAKLINPDVYLIFWDIIYELCCGCKL